MKDITIQPSELSAKLNTGQLTDELAAGLGVSRESVGISTESDANGLIKIVAHVPDNISGSQVVSVIRNHTPDKDDHEELAIREIEEFRNHPVISEMLNRIAALEGGK